MQIHRYADAHPIGQRKVKLAFAISQTVRGVRNNIERPHHKKSFYLLLHLNLDLQLFFECPSGQFWGPFATGHAVISNSDHPYVESPVKINVEN